MSSTTKRMTSAALVLLLFPLLSLFAREPRFPPDIQRIYDRGRLVVAVYANDIYPLFFRDKDGKLAGHEISLAKEIAESLGTEIEFNRTAASFDKVVDLVVEGKADMGISLVSRTMNRVKRARFSRPYLVIHPVLLVNRIFFSRTEGADRLDVLESASFRISEKRGTSYVDMAKDFFPKARVTEKPEWEDVLDDVAKGNADAALRDEIGVTNFVKSNPKMSLNIKLTPLEDVNDYIGVVLAPGSVHLEHWVNTFLEQTGYPIGAKELYRRLERK